ncbi:hypothetical protein L3Q82_008147 [Scortum barcoo]|uniref:Uncharacterized protein n=1 Tax=Scortum barcoo TaxID=214431 RepID=A0ACB8WHS2_9TELE|nr:hypothetical protein L3Q82_008147 [Scortum barcoo]
MTDLEKGKLSPTKGKSVGVKLPPELATTELMGLKKEPDSQISSVIFRKQTVAEEFSIPERQKSKSRDVSKAVKPVSSIGGIIDVESKEAKKEPDSGEASTEQAVKETVKTVVEDSGLSPPKGKPKGLKLSSEETVVEKTKNIATVILDISQPFNTVPVPTEPKVIPARRKSKSLDGSTAIESVSPPGVSIDVASKEAKEGPGSGKASTGQGVTGAIETAVGKDSKLYPPKRKLKGPNTSLELSSKELTQTKEPFSQKPSSTTNMVTATSESIVMEKGKPTPNKEETDIQKSPSSREKIVIAVVEETKLVPATTVVSKSNSQELSGISQIAHMAPEQTEPESSEAGMAPRTISIVQTVSQQIRAPQTKMQKTKIVSESQPLLKEDVTSGVTQKVEPAEESQTGVKNVSSVSEKFIVQFGGAIQELPGKKVATVILDTPEIFVQAPGLVRVDTTFVQPSEIADTSSPHAESSESVLAPVSIMAKPPQSQEPKERSKEAPEQTVTQSTDKDLSTVPQKQPSLSAEPIDTQCLAEYIDNLWKNTPSEEIQKRYLVLDLPETGVSQTCEKKPREPEAETGAESDSSQRITAVFAVPQPQTAESSKISSSNKDIMKPDTETKQERHREDKEHDIKEEHAKVSAHDIHDTSKGVERKSDRMEEVPKEDEVHKQENITVTTDRKPVVDMQQLNIQ